MKKILIATDDSETARAAIDAGLELAEQEQAEIVFVHVTSLLDLSPGNGDEKAPARLPRPETDPVLCAALERAGDRGIEATGELLIGYPPKQILALARDIDADVIMVGSRGLGPVKSAVLGSTSRELVTKANRPVMVVRQTDAARKVGAT
jgi:nucleotide-binding universal stress UspA family protein